MNKFLRHLIVAASSPVPTLFAAFFAITGFILALKGLLTAHYVEMVGAVHAFNVVHSAASDYHDRNKPQDQPQGS
jgi:hypothetical protein